MSNKKQGLNLQDLNSQSEGIKRRDFLRNSIVAATGVAVTVVTGKSLASETQAARVIKADKKEGYRLTKHIADYYRSAAI